MANFPNFHFAEVDGTDAIASYEAMVEAVAYCRAGKGPALVHGHVIRPYSHSLSDDETHYRSASEIEADALKDPVWKMQMWLQREGILDEQGIKDLERSVDEEIQRATDRALAAVLPTTGFDPEACVLGRPAADGRGVRRAAPGDGRQERAHDARPD